MKTILYALPLMAPASSVMAHASAHTHGHFNDPSWMPVLTGLLIMTSAMALLWMRK
jgi:hypothetical protein